MQASVWLVRAAAIVTMHRLLQVDSLPLRVPKDQFPETGPLI